MKIHISRSRLGRMIALVALAPFASFAAETAATPAELANSAAASYVLFTGCDIQIEYLRSLHHVRDVEGGSFVIRLNENQKLAIPMDRNSEKLKVSRVQVLTERAATVTNYKYDRVYTPANDPQRKFAEQMRGLAALSESAERAERAAQKTSETLTVADPSNPGGTKVVPNPAFAATNLSAQLASSQISGSTGQNFYTQQLGQGLASELFDALEVQFDVSATKPIQKPYVVVTARYREKDDAEHVRNWLFAKALPPIDAEPRKVYLQEGGFPPGFEVESLQVHLYERGVEIATDLSENRAPLTRDEAHEYLLIEYLTTHKNDTKPPQVALFDLPDDWATHRAEAPFRKAYYVKVDKTGRPGGAFEDEGRTIPITDAACAEILERLRFVPALEKGQPVDGVSRVVLANLTM